MNQIVETLTRSLQSRERMAAAILKCTNEEKGQRCQRSAHRLGNPFTPSIFVKSEKNGLRIEVEGSENAICLEGETKLSPQKAQEYLNNALGQNPTPTDAPQILRAYKAAFTANPVHLPRWYKINKRKDVEAVEDLQLTEGETSLSPDAALEIVARYQSNHPEWNHHLGKTQNAREEFEGPRLLLILQDNQPCIRLSETITPFEKDPNILLNLPWNYGKPLSQDLTQAKENLLSVLCGYIHETNSNEEGFACLGTPTAYRKKWKWWTGQAISEKDAEEKAKIAFEENWNRTGADILICCAISDLIKLSKEADEVSKICPRPPEEATPLAFT